MVILLNLESLYESLYDALNQVSCEAKKMVLQIMYVHKYFLFLCMCIILIS